MNVEGRASEAETYHRRAINIIESNFGKESRILASYLNNLANLLSDHDRIDEAEELYKRSLAIDKVSNLEFCFINMESMYCEHIITVFPKILTHHQSSV
jgi:tetratricopeptide (TPR) repeat protein